MIVSSKFKINDATIVIAACSDTSSEASRGRSPIANSNLPAARSSRYRANIAVRGAGNKSYSRPCRTRARSGRSTKGASPVAKEEMRAPERRFDRSGRGEPTEGGRAGATSVLEQVNREVLDRPRARASSRNKPTR